MIRAVSGEAHQLLRETRVPVSIDGNWLANQVKQHFTTTYQVISTDEDEAFEELRNVQIKHEAGLGDLARLPRELRDMIFAIPIAAGSVGFTRASKALAQETEEILSKHGICRLNIGYDRCLKVNSYPVFNRTQAVADRIQNLHISVNTAGGGTWNLKKKIHSLRKFVGSRVQRKVCRIVFNSWITTTSMVSPALLEVVKGYTGFEEVVLKIAVDEEETVENLPDFVIERFFYYKNDAINDADKILKHSLGGCWMGTEGGNTTMNYSPREMEGLVEIASDTGSEVGDCDSEQDQSEGEGKGEGEDEEEEI